MTDRELIIKMAHVIKRTIDIADATDNAMLGVEEYPLAKCILPPPLRRDLGECLDDLDKLSDPEEAGTFTLIRNDDGFPYWSGGGPGDKEGMNFDPEQPLILDPYAFWVGTVVSAVEPVPNCKQCSVCEGAKDHHWMPHSEDENDCRMVCKHCKAARAMTEGEMMSDDL
jgi:hypothetical protein